jgi:hypothetical protein
MIFYQKSFAQGLLRGTLSRCQEVSDESSRC